MPGARCGCAAGAVRWAQSSARMSVMSERLLVSLSLALIGLLLLGVALWLRTGDRLCCAAG